MTESSAWYAVMGVTKAVSGEKTTRKKKRSSSRVPRETAAAAPSPAAAATVPSALLPSHSQRRSEGACLGRVEVLVAPRRAVVVEIALTWRRCFGF